MKFKFVLNEKDDPRVFESEYIHSTESVVVRWIQDGEHLDFTYPASNVKEFLAEGSWIIVK